MKVREIQELSEWLQTDYHAKRVSRQNDVDEFYLDTFTVPHVKAPYSVVRLGKGAKLVDVPAAHIVTTHPQVYVEAIAPDNTALERAKKRGSLLNHWVDYLTFQNPHPFQEGIKKTLRRGEQWTHVVNNPNFQNIPFENDIPILFTTPDPLVVFGSPHERNGIPDYVVVSYKRYYRAVQNKYEHWTNPKHRSDSDKYANWLEYWDKDVRYFECDGQPVLTMAEEFDWGGVEPNILGVCPWVHSYSGYGDKTASGDPADLAVSRIWNERGKIMELTVARSYLASQLKIHTVGRVKIKAEALEFNEVAESLKWDLDVGGKNVEPFGVVAQEYTGAEPSPALYNYIYLLESDIEKITPPVMEGVGTEGSGRLADIYTKHALAQYETVLRNSATNWSTSLGLAQRILKNKDLKLLPVSVMASTLDKGRKVGKEIKVEDSDIDSFRCELKLKAADPIEDKAQAQIGTNWQSAGVIDWETNLTKYQGYSLDEAREIMNKTMAEKLIFSNPQIMEAMALEAMKELGMEQVAAMATPERGPVFGQPGAEGGAPRRGNIRNINSLAQDAEMMVAPRSPRAAPGLGR
tara:strand:- start:272 stop:2002 length:1731 start_codon:yes stop_codon:yes gene_type:complete